MSSLLTFALRNQNVHLEKSNRDEQNFDDSPGVIRTSSSGETVDENLPRTPEGLRRRTSPESIRANLGVLPKRKFQWTEAGQVPANESMHSSPSLGFVNPPPSMPCDTVCSPQISTSSFYSRASARSSRQVAKSPNLAVGQAKTAVGALLAVSDAKASFHDRMRNSMSTHSSILPPKQWNDQKDRDEEMENEEASMNSQSILPSPPPSDDEDESFAHASPSSNYKRNNVSWYGKRQIQTSFSRSFHKRSVDHPFHIHTFEDSAGTDSDLNASGISRSSKELESLYSLVDDVADEDILSNCEEMMVSEKEHFDSNRDALLFSVIERLQDDTELVMEILDTATQHTTTDRSFKLQEENFIKGFSKSNRDCLLKIFDEMLNKETNIGPLSGSTKHAFNFCRALTRTAVPESEKPMKLQSMTSGVPQHGRWKCIPGFRAAVGLDEDPKSPETIRGGDTSLFSLPSESATDLTPHASNVSVTTTITSAFSPDKNERLLGFNHQRRSLRQTLDTVITLFDHLGTECVALMGVSESNPGRLVQTKGEITRIYLQFQKVSADNLERLIDSFELDVLPAPILRILSKDNEEKNRGEQVAAVQNTITVSQEPLPVKDLEERQDSENRLFSPSTVDMMSIEASTSKPSSVDQNDLRRSTETFGNANLSETREPSPPATLQRAPTTTLEKRKTRRSIWKRKYFRRKAKE